MELNGNMKEFFQNLKEIRLQKGLTLEDIARKSRLPLKYLQDIEEGNFDNLPTGYARIFFKRYLKEIGEDTPEVWRDFNLFFGTSSQEEYQAGSADREKKKQEPLKFGEEIPLEEPLLPKERPSFWQELSLRLNMDKLHAYFWIFLTITVLSVVGYFAYKQYLFVKSSELQVKEITVSDFIEQMQKQDSLLTPQLSDNTASRSVGAGEVIVELHALYRTWIREIRDQEDTSDYILPAGLKRTISARETVQLLLGRADGVEIRLNGQDLGIMGGADEVVLRLVLNRDGIAEKRLKKVLRATPSPAPANSADSTEQSQTEENLPNSGA